MSGHLLDEHGHARWLRQTLTEAHLLDFLSPAAAQAVIATVAAAVVAHQRSPRAAQPPEALRVPVMRALAEHPLGGVLTGTWRHQVAEVVACGYATALSLHPAATG